MIKYKNGDRVIKSSFGKGTFLYYPFSTTKAFVRIKFDELVPEEYSYPASHIVTVLTEDIKPISSEEEI